jgi:hypothetical protein
MARPAFLRKETSPRERLIVAERKVETLRYQLSQTEGKIRETQDELGWLLRQDPEGDPIGGSRNPEYQAVYKRYVELTRQRSRLLDDVDTAKYDFEETKRTAYPVWHEDLLVRLGHSLQDLGEVLSQALPFIEQIHDIHHEASALPQDRILPGTKALEDANLAGLHAQVRAIGQRALKLALEAKAEREKRESWGRPANLAREAREQARAQVQYVEVAPAFPAPVAE